MTTPPASTAAAVSILKAHDIVLAQIRPGLHFDNFQAMRSGFPAIPDPDTTHDVRPKRGMQHAGAMFEAPSKTFELARIDEGKNNFLIQVFDAAVAPGRITSPSPGVACWY